MTFTLLDDGTLDTVVRCDRCGREERYSDSSDYRDSHGFLDEDRFFEEVVAEDHEC